MLLFRPLNQSLVAASFAWPFRGGWKRSWIVGVPVVLLSPVLFILLLGYAVEATRAAQRDRTTGPPAWRLTGRLLGDGALTTVAVLLNLVPFALLFAPLGGVIDAARIWPPGDPALARFESRVLAAFILALPWGLVALVWLPHATARYAASGRPRDLFDVAASVKSVRRGFGAWNLAIAAVVTGWAIGLAGAGLLCIGLVPGVYYAILVSAHASATLEKTRAEKAGEAASRGPSAG